jgi:hypothetical protein
VIFKILAIANNRGITAVANTAFHERQFEITFGGNHFKTFKTSRFKDDYRRVSQ